MRDINILDCAVMAQAVIDEGGQILQKWTCSHCGSRQTMAEFDRFFRAGICEECKETTIIRECGFSALFRRRA
jgi:hypothetical protein